MSAEGFDFELSDDVTIKYDGQSSLVSDLLGGTVATVADFGASVWNSLPGTEEVATEDLLARIDSNALRVYEENPDTIHTASFIGGIFVPAGFALKGMNAARNGVKGANWFSKAGEVERKANLERLFADGAKATAEFREAMRYQKASVWGNALADAAAMEVAILGTMNAHPFLEDYVENPAKHFITNTLIGGGIIGTFGHIMNKAAIKNLEAGVESDAFKVAYEGSTAVDTGWHMSEQLSMRARNVENWEGLLKDETRNLNGYTKSLLETLVAKEKAAIVDNFDSIASAEIRTLPMEDKANLITLLTNNPDKFAGIDSIRYATAQEDLPAVIKPIKGLVESTFRNPAKGDFELPLLTTTKKGVDKGVTMIYSPKFKAFMLSQDFKHYGTAGDFIQDAEQLTKGVERNWHYVPRYDQSFENMARTTAAIDADYLKALKYYDELPIEEFKKGMIAVAPDDTAVLNAIFARMAKEVATDPNVFNDLKIQITREIPKYDMAGTKIIERVITNTITKTITGAGQQAFNKNALNEMTNLLRGNNRLMMDLMEQTNSLSYEARTLARSFSTDQMWPLHNGLEIFRRKNSIPQKTLSEQQAIMWGSDNYKAARASGKSHEQAMKLYGDETSNLGKYAEELVNSKETRMLKAELAKHADSEGYIFLYRGMRGKAQGHSPGESYTPDYSVALSFGGSPANVSLYKVHLDEVVGYLGQFGSRVGGEAEIVLDVPTRLVAGKLQPITGKQASGHTMTEVLTGSDIKEIVKEVSSTAKEAANMTQVLQTLAKSKQATVIEMLQRGVPMETISLHTNVPLDTIKYVATSGEDIADLGLPFLTYSNAAEIGTYLNKADRALAVSTDVAKVPVARVRAALHKQNMDIADHEIKTAFILDSASRTSREVGKYLLNEDTKVGLAVLRQKLDEIVGSKVGGRFFSSADFSLRNLGEVGAIISSIGKDVTGLINKQFENIWHPMKDSFASISKDPAAIVELSTALNINAGLQGYRVFKDGKFYIQDAVEPFKDVVDATGKVVGRERNMIPVLHNGAEFEVKTASVKAALDEMQKTGKELYQLRGTMNKIIGRPQFNDIGFWAPPFNPRNKHIAYVYDKVEDRTMLLFGKTEEEKNAAIRAYQQTLDPADIGRRYEFITDKTDQQLYNKIKGRHDPIFMGSANSGMLHSGASQTAIVNTNADVLADLANGYEHYVGYAVRSLMDSAMSDIITRFDDISHLSQKAFKDQPLNVIQKFIQKPKDEGHTLKHTLLGNSDLNEYAAWQNMSNVTNLGTEWALRQISNLFEPILNKGASILGKGKVGSDKEYTDLINQLKVRGIANPFEGMDDFTARHIFHTQRISDSPNMTPRVLALSNGLAATVMLRVGELAQPFVNAISLPILSSGAMSRKLAASFNGVAVDPKAKFGVIETMYNGMRYSNSADGMALVKQAEERGLFKPVVSEATQVLSEARSLEPGVISALEKGLNSNLVNILSKPADWAETWTRRQAFLTGAYIAKTAYPGLGKSGQMIYARNFMDEVIGNYHAAQRPVMFQGTVGVAMGLFQTYMLTMAQQIYKQIERKDFKALAKMMLTQQTIFGARSLPGFNQVSEYIGEHFSDQNFDLTTGTYRALPDPIADIVIYGLPSNFGPGITTRGEIQPRIPNFLANGVTDIPAINIAAQAYQSLDKIASAAFTADASTGKAMLEAISMQSVSRPVARLSELFSGHAVNQAGNLVSSPEEIYTPASILSRVMATRPLQEIKAREAMYLDKMYGSLDREARMKVTKKLRTYLRDGNLDADILEELAEQYMRTGSPRGWRAAMNMAIAQTSEPGSNIVRNYLDPDSPLNLMIDDLE